MSKSSEPLQNTESDQISEEEYAEITRRYRSQKIAAQPWGNLDEHSIGEVVHYTIQHGTNLGAIRPAIIVDYERNADGLPTGRIDLVVLPARKDGYMDPVIFAEAAEYDLTKTGTWHFRRDSA